METIEIKKCEKKDDTKQIGQQGEQIEHQCRNIGADSPIDSGSVAS